MSAVTPASHADKADIFLDHWLPLATKSQLWVRNMLVVLMGSACLTLSAKLSLPFFPVPLTLQTLVVLALGMLLGPRLGALTVIAYLAQGALGMPVFQGTPEKGIGLAYMMGPTGGYLVGFVVAAFVVGLLAKRHWDRSPLRTIGAMVIGNAVIYAFGLVWLGSLMGWDKPILAWGMQPFLLGDFVKILIAAAVLPALWKLEKRHD